MGVTDCILYLTTPEFVPCLVAGILYGIGAIILYDKSKRHKFFLSYFYLGSGALLYSVAEVFDLVWNRSEGEKSDFPLHASLLLLTFGATFFFLALFRLLETWQQVGMREGRRSLSLLAPGAILIAMLISMVGDVLMVQQDQAAEHDEEDVTKTRVALQLQTAGAAMNLVILVLFFIFLGSLARRRKGQSVLAIVLACLGGLILIRWIYYSYLLGSMLMTVMQAEDADYSVDLPGWPVSIGLFIVPEILAIALSILYDLTQVKNGVEQLEHHGFVHLNEAQGMQHV